MSCNGEEKAQVNPTRLPRSQFRKQKKLEKRRARRQLNAEKNAPVIEPPSQVQLTLEKQQYERDKALWEEREEKFKLIELAKKRANEKRENAKALSQRKWQETLLNLPLMTPRFPERKNTAFKTFVQPTTAPEQKPKRKTYRDRYLEQKLTKSLQ